MMDSLESKPVLSPPLSAKLPARRSPPLAFEKTPNDSLAPLTSPRSQSRPITDSFKTSSPSLSPMGRSSPPPGAHEMELQLIVDQQANAIHLLHEAFAAERQAWSLEKERLHARIAALEKLLKNGHHHSPAKSPVMSPMNDSDSVMSPTSRATTSAPRLPSIAEDESIQPLSKRREGAPQSIDLPVPEITSIGRGRESSVSFTDDEASLKVEEIPISPPTTAKGLSPPPLNNRMAAGHTPLKAPRPPTPPPQDMNMDGIDDTPTRHNTHINNFLTKTNDDDGDNALTGPLNMPELPNKPDATNFTLEALSKRLEQIEHNPDDAKPMVFAEPSPGLASPAEPRSDTSLLTAEKITAGALEPLSTRNGDVSQSDMGSNTLSHSTSAMSPNGAPLSQQESHELKVHHDFEHGGIKLKKKPSTNFGAPFGQLGGFGGMRKMS